MATFIIYKDKVEQKRFENQESDLLLFQYMLKNQGQSIHWAIKYEGWSIEMENEEGKFIMKPKKLNLEWEQVNKTQKL